MDESNILARDQSEGHKALLELESKFNKKSRSAALSIQGSQIQALTGFNHIFEQYPYPVVINAAILKLADWFRTYNNNVKYYVYKVFKEASDVHLAKVFNVEEIVRRILPILGSNDPIARSITLRVLGCMSMIIGEKLDVQFGIIQRLELATDRIELEAAIWAGDQICARSRRFPSVIFAKVVDKLESPDTPFDMKLRLVKIFRHMHQDIGMAREAKLTCLVLLKDPNTDCKLVIVTLRTLTLLLSEAVIDRKEQIDRLLDFAMHDARDDICYNVLYDLLLLGKNDIMFDETHIVRLLQVIICAKNHKIQQKAIQCAQGLIETHQKLILKITSLDPNSSTYQTFVQYIWDCEQILHKAIMLQQFPILIANAKLLYIVLRIFLSHHTVTDENAMEVTIPLLPKMKELGRRVAEAITKVDINLIIQDRCLKQRNRSVLRELLKIKAKYCLLLADWDCDTTFRDAYTMLTNANDDIAAVLLPYLSNISKKCNQLLSWFPHEAPNELQKRVTRPSVYLNLIRLLLRTTVSSHELTNKLVDSLHQFGAWDKQAEKFSKNGWSIYLIGIEAGSCGWYELMHVIMRDLCKKAETEACFYWLSSLSSLALGEWNLSSTEKPPLDHYIKSMTELKALQSFDQPRTKQYWYLQLRMEFIESIQHTMQTLDTQMTSYKRLAKQLRSCAVQFRNIAFRYDFLAQSQFGAEKELLQVIESYKICALACEHAVRTFVGSDQLFLCIDPSLIPLINKEPSPNISTMDPVARMMELCRGFVCTTTHWEELAHLEEIDRIKTCTPDMKGILQAILKEPLILPKSFFKSLKNVNIQLTTEPMMSEKLPVKLQPNEDLVIKFEGLVEVDQRAKNLEKRIKKAIIVCFVTKEKLLHYNDRIGVNMIFSEPVQMLGDQTQLLQPPTVYIANVRNSYFTYTGLLSLPKSKSPELLPLTKKEAWVNVFVKILDENSGIWSVGPLKWGKVIWQ